MYAVHNTNAVILSEYQKGDTHKVYQVYSRQYGLIYVEGTSIRKAHSKMRGSMQLFNLVNISFVVGKRNRILVHADVLFSPHTESERLFLSRILERIKRLVKGEEMNNDLFNEIEAAYAIMRHENVDDEIFSRGFEYTFLIKILHNLGYWAEEEITKKLFSLGPYEASLIAYSERKILVPHIKTALAHTGMY